MDKNKAIGDVYKMHGDLILFVLKHSLNDTQKAYPEDFVQEFYIRLLESATFESDLFYYDDGSVNKQYVYSSLKNLMINDYKKKTIDIDNEGKKDIEQYKQEDVIQSKPKDPYTWFKKVENAMHEQHWFDKKMMNLYIYQIPNMRQISKETQISVDTIFKTIKRSKTIIKTKLDNEYKSA